MSSVRVLRKMALLHALPVHLVLCLLLLPQILFFRLLVFLGCPPCGAAFGIHGLNGIRRFIGIRRLVLLCSRRHAEARAAQGQAEDGGKLFHRVLELPTNARTSLPETECFAMAR